MGRAKAAMMENEHNYEIIEFLEEQLRCDELSGAAEGIAKYAIDKGIDALSDKQSDVINKILINFKAEHVCPRCDNGNVSQISEYIFMKDSELCPMCESDREKFMKD